MTATRIDPNELTPSNPDGAAASVPEFYDAVIAAINEHADEIDTLDTVPVTAKNVVAYGATGNGVTDDRIAISNAIAAAITSGLDVYFPPGTYKVSKYALLFGARNITLWGRHATIVYPSDDTTVGTDGTATNLSEARAALFLRYCRGVRIQGLTFEGGQKQDIDTVNVGCGIYQTRCRDTIVDGCTARFGYSLHAQDSTTGTTAFGSSISVSGGVTTVTLSTASFTPGHQDARITITKTNDIRNQGIFRVVSYISTTKVTIDNANAVAETSTFRATLDDEDRGTRIINCTSFHVRGTITVGKDFSISKCIWEYPATPDHVGTQSAGSGFSLSGTTVTLTDRRGPFKPEMDGKYVIIAGASTSANNGTFKLTYISRNSISWTNASGVTEGYSGIWWIPNGERVGLGGGTGAISMSGTTCTFTSAAAAFSAGDVNSAVRLANPMTAGNAVNATITAVLSPTQVTFDSPTGVSEDFSGLWTLDSFDRIGSNTIGSSHAIYLFGDRANGTIEDCVFRYNRTTCVKISGTDLPLRNITIRGCAAIECAIFVLAGADDVNEHSSVIISNNTLIDCGTQRIGWNNNDAIQLLGGRGWIVADNTFHYTRQSPLKAAGLTTGGLVGIRVERYVAGASQPVESVSVERNHFYGVAGLAQVVQSAIQVSDVGELARWNTSANLSLAKSSNTITLTDPAGLFANTTALNDVVGETVTIKDATTSGNNGSFTITAATKTTISWTNASGAAQAQGSSFTYRINPTRRGGTASIAGNEISNIATYGINCVNNLGPQVHGNVFTGLIHNMGFDGDCAPMVYGNKEIGRGTTSGAIWMKNTVSWPSFWDNTITNQAIGPQAAHAMDISLDGTTSVDYPLLGKTGRMRPTGALEEVVVAYGANHVNGDTIVVDGNTFTYHASAPSGSQFNSFAGLVTLIGAIAGYSCADYGTGFSAGDIATQHLRIRKTAQTTSDGTFTVTVSTLNPTALVLLRNASNALSCLSRGSGSAGPVADGSVVWTLMCSLPGGAIIWPDNSAAQTLLQASGWRPVKNVNDAGCCETIKHGTAAGTEEFRWSYR